ncbi:hypothetical protein KJ865_02830 [Myxococcota bacterium]|nr:hypothetical protein [Myxococcota bacterium]
MINTSFQWHEVEQFGDAFWQKSKSDAALANICKPAVDRWQTLYKEAALDDYKEARMIWERTKKTGDPVLMGNAESEFKDAKKAKDKLEIFKKDLGSFVRFYEFMSQIVEYNERDLEKMSLYARNLRPMLRESLEMIDAIDLENVLLSHYRLSEIKRQNLKLKSDAEDYKLVPGNELGSTKAKDKKEEYLSQIIERLNELFITDELTDGDVVNYAYTISDKVSKNERVMEQIANNTEEQAMLGDFPKAVDDAILDSSSAHQNQMMQLLSDPKKASGFANLIFELLQRVGIKGEMRVGR